MKKVFQIIAVLAILFQKLEATIEIAHRRKKYVLTRTDGTYLLDEYTFLFHVTNLTKIIKSYEEIFDKNSYPNVEKQVLMKKIETLIDRKTWIKFFGIDSKIHYWHTRP